MTDLADTRSHLQRILARFTDPVLADITAAANNTMPVGSDGYPVSTRSDGTPHGTAELTTVEAHAIRRVDSHLHDPVAAWARDAAAMLRTAASLVDQADRRRTLIARNRQAGRAEQAPSCVTCGDPAIWPDRPTAKAGRCQRCYWHRYRYDHDWRPRTDAFPGCCANDQPQPATTDETPGS